MQIIRLESERAQWEQRYLEETAMRQVAIDAAAIPKDAKIAALEKSSTDAEKVISEARVEKMKQLEEMQNNQVRQHVQHTLLFRAPVGVGNILTVPSALKLLLLLLGPCDRATFPLLV